MSTATLRTSKRASARRVGPARRNPHPASRRGGAFFAAQCDCSSCSWLTSQPNSVSCNDFAGLVASCSICSQGVVLRSGQHLLPELELDF